MTVSQPTSHPPADGCVARDILAGHQATRLHTLLRTIDGPNGFYTKKLATAGFRAADIGDEPDLPTLLGALPFTTKGELVADQATHPPWGTARTEPLERYTRYNQTSSTTGRPLRWLDTNDSWQWALDCWKAVYRAAHVGTADRILFPFSFGPFLGFWTAFEAGTQIGAHCVPAGGMDSETRLGLVEATSPTVVCCTPTYALRLLEVSQDARNSEHRLLARSSVRVLIVAGEPGGSIPGTRRRIEKGWGARVIDHHGLTETGPLSFECWENPGGLHLNEREFVCEVVDPASTEPVADGDQGELVVTTLGRVASPVVRYRTGDLVIREDRKAGPCRCGRTLARVSGGVLARVDDMVWIRGVNVYPTAVETVIRAIDDVVEYRATVRTADALRSLTVEAEVSPALTDQEGDRVAALAASRLRDALGLTVSVSIVATGTLPRFEMKSKRFRLEDPTCPP